MQTANAKRGFTRDEIMAAIARTVESDAYKTWVAPCKFDICDNVLTVCAANQFSADFIKSVHMKKIQSAVNEFGLALEIAVANSAVKSVAVNDNAQKTFTPETSNLKLQTSFDDFIVSPENEFAVMAAKKMASGAATFSPLYIYGAAGCGKSLLAKCINSESGGNVLMMTGARFVAEFLRAIREQSIFAFKDFCRKCDTFILDDVHALAGKRATADEFTNLLMDLIAAKKNIVITSNVAPNNLSGFDRRLQSLLASGLVADLIPVGADVKQEMLKRAGVDANIAETLAARVSGDGHMIAGVAKKIQTYVELMGERVTITIAERLLGDVMAKTKTPIAMVKSMCDKLGVSYDAVCGAGRARTVVRARMVMMTALKSATKLTLAEIGNLVGGRDHATVLYAIGQVEKLKSLDLIMGAQVDQMIAECR